MAAYTDCASTAELSINAIAYWTRGKQARLSSESGSSFEKNRFKD
jgi:hypothetical protein